MVAERLARRAFPGLGGQQAATAGLGLPGRVPDQPGTGALAPAGRLHQRDHVCHVGVLALGQGQRVPAPDPPAAVPGQPGLRVVLGPAQRQPGAEHALGHGRPVRVIDWLPGQVHLMAEPHRARLGGRVEPFVPHLSS